MKESFQSVFVAIGSNMDTPLEQVKRAFAAIESLVTVCNSRLSPCYQTAPQEVIEQADFVNAVCRFDTNAPALEILAAMQAIENSSGRVRSRRFGPRTLDLDILLYGDLQVHSRPLIIPHPRMQQRRFVLQPLIDLAGDISIPGVGQLSDCLAKTLDQPIRRLP